MHSSRIRTHAQAVWAKVLSTDVDDTTDFFESGGHSFAAMRITVLLDEALQTRTETQLLFDYPLFADYVAALTTSLDAPSLDPADRPQQ
ncbi:phosphopantetheine-binding protein [Streptomyces sp. ERV7]|uniref:phosphopantetheine-binding protein n=1 Tax=Streptomyces sp. ERV7 TaxID=1322334 RepID=UPI00131D5424|nr:phosphopantetheine-binding protein [Streptomyces sp. ERV7]